LYKKNELYLNSLIQFGFNASAILLPKSNSKILLAGAFFKKSFKFESKHKHQITIYPALFIFFYSKQVLGF